MLVMKVTLMKKNIELQEKENIKEQLLLMEKFTLSFANVSKNTEGRGGQVVDGEFDLSLQYWGTKERRGCENHWDSKIMSLF